MPMIRSLSRANKQLFEALTATSCPSAEHGAV